MDTNRLSSRLASSRVEFKIRNRILVGNSGVYDTFTTQHVPFSKFPFFEHAMSRELITSWEYLSLFAETDRGICRNCCCSLCRNKGAINKLLFQRGEKGTGSVIRRRFQFAQKYFILEPNSLFPNTFDTFMTLINPYNSSFISRFLSNVYCSCRSSTDRSSFQCEIKIFQFIVLFNDSIVKFRIIKF